MHKQGYIPYPYEIEVYDPPEVLIKLEKIEYFVTKKVVNNTSLKYIGESLEIDLRGTVVGKSLRTGLPVKIDDTAEGNYTRFSKSEDLSFDGSFLAIPIIYNKQIYGVICFENLKKNAYTNQDVQFLKNSFN